MSRNTITVPIYTNRDQIDVSFPARWVICSECAGNASTSRHVECDGGGFTASEWNDQDDDFRQDYMAGVYDRPCDCCDGKGRIQIIDQKAVLGWRERIFLTAFKKQERDNREIDAMQAAERRMGA
jgi:RecJ-like exonuclease